MPEGNSLFMNFPYIYRWDRQGRKNQRCAVLVRGTMNSCLVAFEDGYQMVTSRNAIRKDRELAIHKEKGRIGGSERP